ncbi:uncharacterized protein LOC120140629 [Hibiscus syriacus]|uniref:uncharacterized protein LOC120140629 n=1 Tax=Hibiscus syriacus TaxID=106335 RepID=UPI0019249B23|nr:uncharacterized protein LOC120140629 [Hibiscus syriacus]
MKLFCSALILCVVTLKSLSTCNFEFSYNHLSLFVLFNAIIVSVIFVSHKQSIDESDGDCSVSEVGASFDQTERSDIVDVYKDDTDISSGYCEDDDHENNNDCSCYGGEEEYGDDLHQRIEDFIAKVNNGWREECLSENDRERPWMG